jgi:DNA-binding CsgD family transcriptional regulator
VSAAADSAAALACVGQALGRLRGAASVEAQFHNAAQALCEDAGFERAAVFSLRGRTLHAESVYVGGPQGEAGRDLARVCSGSFQLGPWLRESEALRRRRPLLIGDAANDPRALGLLPGASSYVLAPLVCQQSAVALVHADRGVTGSVVTELDREKLRAFVEGLGLALERAVLAERLRAQSERVLDLVRSTAASVRELSRSGLELPSSGLSASVSGNETAPDHELDELLTRRELQVLAVLAEGETNARIAERLVVSEDTVKTHVKSILRKLGLHNRSQAVSRYFRAHAGLADGPSGTRAAAYGPG